MSERHIYRSNRWSDRLLVIVAVGAVAIIALTAVLRDRPLASASPSPLGSSSTTATTAPPAALNIGLVAAFNAAQAAASADGEELVINDGFRTAATQQAMYDAEIVERGSVEEASRWVFPPDKSMHVQGLAIDVGNGPAADWLDAHGSEWGLCRTLDWEWWHFEWRQSWEDSQSCPDLAMDPSEAPTVDG